MSYASASRTDGGFFVRGCAIHCGLETDAPVVAMFASVSIGRMPGVLVKVANLLNDEAGLPQIRTPKPKEEAAA